MRVHRRAAALALCLGVLAACDGGDPSSGSGQGGGTAPPPTASGAPTTGGGTAVPEGSLKGKVIAIDPGHNGGNADAPARINKQVRIGNGSKACDTTGTSTDGGYAEHAFTWDVSKRLARLLRDGGAKVVMTRKNDKGVGPCITERAAIGNKADADAALSVHADGARPAAHGFHMILPLPVQGNADIVEPSRKLAVALRDAYKDGTGLPYSTYRGKKALDPRDDLGGLNLTRVPKVFIECGNMRNPKEAALLRDAAFRQRIADSLARGFTAYFGA